mmetsp:Transcript_5327/g.7498  ORF Transcript_5327/g.7498 Transcript_5327/m.7498 type:complete len:153 (-) Transcript_5327:170-628(-)
MYERLQEVPAPPSPSDLVVHHPTQGPLKMTAVQFSQRPKSLQPEDEEVGLEDEALRASRNRCSRKGTRSRKSISDQAWPQRLTTPRPMFVRCRCRINADPNGSPVLRCSVCGAVWCNNATGIESNADAASNEASWESSGSSSGRLLTRKSRA